MRTQVEVVKKILAAEVTLSEVQVCSKAAMQ